MNSVCCRVYMLTKVHLGVYKEMEWKNLKILFGCYKINEWKGMEWNGK